MYSTHRTGAVAAYNIQAISTSPTVSKGRVENNLAKSYFTATFMCLLPRCSVPHGPAYTYFFSFQTTTHETKTMTRMKKKKKKKKTFCQFRFRVGDAAGGQKKRGLFTDLVFLLDGCNVEV